MLEIANIEYRLSDLRKIGLAAQETGNVLTDTTSIGPNGLTWGHLRDPRIEILVTAPAKYRFQSWNQLTLTLDASWVLAELDETDEATPDIPAVLDGHLVLPRTAPFELAADATLEDTFARVRAATDTRPDLVSIAKPDKSWATAATGANRIDRHNALQKLWGACGPASQSLIERLYAADAGVIVTFDRVFEGAHDARMLEAVLRLPVKETVLIQIVEPSIHEFTIEKRADGTAYLHQGYLGAYSALWWAGVKGADAKPFFTLGGNEARTMREQREMFGRGQSIAAESFAWLMQSYLSADTYGAASGAAWKMLPFNPAADYAHMPLSGPIALQVKGFQLVDEATARKHLRDEGRNLPLTTLVMQEAAQLLAK